MLAPLTTQSKAVLSNESDPIFAAIERHRAAYLAWMKPLSVESRTIGAEHVEAAQHADPYMRAVEDALDEIGETIPTTMEGVLALLAYIDDVNCDRMLPQDVRFLDPELPIFTSHLEWPDWERERDDVQPNAIGNQPEETWPLRVMRNIHTALENLRKEGVPA